MKTKAAAITHAGIPKRNLALGLSMPKIEMSASEKRATENEYADQRPLVRSFEVLRSVTNTAGITVMAVRSHANGFRPICSSTRCPKYQNTTRSMRPQMLGGLTSGQVSRRQASPSRTSSEENAPFITSSGVRAYSTIDPRLTSTTSTVVVTSMFPSRNHPSRC